ncbi:MAG: AAA family ATPase, partial [Oscillospiraceae bacterium]|nr:AAA family ATPase [Oscillospiraceae bacterium]
MYKFNGFTDKANKALNLSIEAAQSLGHTYVGSEHLLLGLLKEPSGVAHNILDNRGITAEKITELLESRVGRGSKTNLTPDDLTPRAKRILETAVLGARSVGNTFVGTEHLLASILDEGDNYAVRFLNELNTNPRDIASDVMSVMGINPEEAKVGAGKAVGGRTQNKQPSKTPTLDQFGRDLTEEAAKGKIDPVIGRAAEIERVTQILSRRTKNNPCLIGEPGVGKTAVAEGLALKISADEVPETLKNKRIISLDLTGMVAGTKYRGDFEERIKNAMDEAKNSDSVILFIDELHTIIGAGSAEGSADAATMLKPLLAR